MTSPQTSSIPSLTAAWIVFLLLAATPATALAQTFTPGPAPFPVSFTGSTGVNIGANPSAPLILGTDGNFYGTTLAGGTGNFGTIFKMTPGGIITVLYNFQDGADGTGPSGALIQGTDGNFYGTTNGQNGQDGNGTIFQYNPSAAVLTTLYTFTGGSDGGVPLGGILQGADGNLYGTTSQDGSNGDGTIFAVAPPFTAGLVTLYAFCSAPNCTDGGTRYTAAAGGGAAGEPKFACIPALVRQYQRVFDRRSAGQRLCAARQRRGGAAGQ
jgi:uncharacterized repeat protein (TIGR03803 family)